MDMVLFHQLNNNINKVECKFFLGRGYIMKCHNNNINKVECKWIFRNKGNRRNKSNNLNITERKTLRGIRTTK